MSTNANSYGAGIMAKTGKAFADEYFAEENQVCKETNDVVLVLKKSDEMNTVVQEILLGDHKDDNPTLVVEDRAGYWWLKRPVKLKLIVVKSLNCWVNTLAFMTFWWMFLQLLVALIRWMRPLPSHQN